jgi:hypothetical protein
MNEIKPNVPDGIYFDGFNVKGRQPYPCWRYHAVKDPQIVHNTDEDKKLRLLGYEEMQAPMMANTGLINWFWDIEDMSPRQLCVFAKEEYDVDLPVDAPQEKLQRAVLLLAKNAPQNRDRIVLMAHTIKMHYEETLEEIRKLSNNGMSEVTREVVML